MDKQGGTALDDQKKRDRFERAGGIDNVVCCSYLISGKRVRGAEEKVCGKEKNLRRKQKKS